MDSEDDELSPKIVIRQKRKRTLAQLTREVDEKLAEPKKKSVPAPVHKHTQPAQMVVDNFDTLRLEENLGSSDPVELSMFRLFLYSVVYGQHDVFEHPKKAWFEQVLEHLSQVKEQSYNYEEKFVKEGQTTVKEVKADDARYIKHETTAIEVPPFILKRIGVGLE